MVAIRLARCGPDEAIAESGETFHDDRELQGVENEESSQTRCGSGQVRRRRVACGWPAQWEARNPRTPGIWRFGSDADEAIKDPRD